MLQHDWSSANPKGPMSHLSLSPCTGSQLQLASSSRHWCLHIEQLQAQHRLLPLTYNNLHPLQKSEICEWATPRGAITERHKITFQSVFIHRPWLVEWTSHPHPECWVPDNFQKLISSIFTWLLLLHNKKQNKKLSCSLFLTSHCLASFCSDQCLTFVLQALPVTVCLFIMYRLLYSSIVSRFG